MITIEGPQKLPCTLSEGEWICGNNSTTQHTTKKKVWGSQKGNV